MSARFPYQPLLLQYLRFGAVGLSATATHALVFVFAIEAFSVRPLIANLIAFVMAFSVSFSGHFHLTFRPETESSRRSASSATLARFLIVALTGLALNSLVVYVVTDLLDWPYQVALALMVSAVPVVVFALSKHWAFAPAVR